MADENVEKQTISVGDVGELKLEPEAPKKLSVKKTIFCAKDQKETEHELTRAVDRNGHNEITAVCAECGRSLKFPVPTDQAQFDAWLAAHKTANDGHISVEKAAADEAAKDAEFLSSLGVSG